jgi:hypothetical protein
MGKGNTTAAWQVGQRVATPNGFVAEIVSLRDRQAMIRYLGPHAGPEEILLPYTLLRHATAHDLVRAGVT